jgi:CheY-like chemotaxis protein/predicted transcriptional regulator
MNWDGSFSIAVVRRLLGVLYEHSSGINRTNLAGKAGLNYGTCTRYVDLLVLLRWVSLAQTHGTPVYLTRTGKEFMELLAKADNGELKDDRMQVTGFWKSHDDNRKVSRVQTDSILDRHRQSDYTSRLKDDVKHVNGAASIMIIEDELDLLLTYELLLEGQGFNVYAFSDPRLALREFAKNSQHIDLVISDIRMNSINGIQLYKELKAIAPDLRIIFVSALDAAPELASALPGFKKEDLIAKPVDQAKLSKSIHAALVEIELAKHDTGVKQQTYN